MALTDFKPQFDNAYQEIFQKVLVAKSIANFRFEPVLKYGESVERVAYNIDGVLVRSVTRGSASTVDSITDSSELLTINYEKEAVFHISDGEVKQAGPLNPGEVIGGQVAIKVAVDFDANVMAEILNATYTFDTGDLTTLASTGVPFALDSTNIPLLITRGPAKLRKNNQMLTSLALVVDSYGAAAIENYLLTKDWNIAESTFANGYAGNVHQAEVYVSENLPASAELVASDVFVNTQTVVINGVTFTSVTSIGTTAGNFLIGANLLASLTNLAGLINNPGTTSATQVALDSDDQITMAAFSASVDTDTLTLVGTGTGRLTLSETQTNVAWQYNTLHCYFGKKNAIDVVMQDLKEVDMRPTADRRGTNVFSSCLGGIKTFADGAKKFLNVKITA